MICRVRDHAKTLRNIKNFWNAFAPFFFSFFLLSCIKKKMKPVLIFTAYCFSVVVVIFHWKLAKPFLVKNGILLFPGLLGFNRFPIAEPKRERFGYFLHITDMHVSAWDRIEQVDIFFLKKKKKDRQGLQRKQIFQVSLPQIERIQPFIWQMGLTWRKMWRTDQLGRTDSEMDIKRMGR